MPPPAVLALAIVSPGTGWTLLSAEGPAEVAVVGAVFAEYGAAPQVQACVSTLGAEIAGLPGEYAPPGGRLILAMAADTAAGCVALRRQDQRRAEMKRLFVRPAFRGQGLGRVLTGAAIESARAAGYDELVLDTLPSMTEAIALYQRLGFAAIAPYASAPTPGAMHFALRLR
jgi:putative acetyltransferase